jgi:hypothetical protein
MAAESVAQEPGAELDSDASMRPRPNGRGKTPGSLPPPRLAAASMRPRPNGRGKSGDRRADEG